MNSFEEAIAKFYAKEQFEKIQSAKIGIAGAGGLGSNIAVALVRSGFKNFEIIDFDDLELSNLNRQYYFLDEVGKPKVELLAARLKNINPDIEIKAAKVKLSFSTIADYFNDAEILCEAFDNVESKQLLLEEYGNSDKIIIMGSGMAGMSTLREIKIRKLNNKHYIVGDGKTDTRDGEKPYAPRVAVCAGLMAAKVLEIVTL